jgi:hypothetical protein
MTRLLPKLNRSALITAWLFAGIQLADWAVSKWVVGWDPKLAGILSAAVLASGLAMGVVSDSRKPTPPK